MDGFNFLTPKTKSEEERLTFFRKAGRQTATIVSVASSVLMKSLHSLQVHFPLSISFQSFPIFKFSPYDLMPRNKLLCAQGVRPSESSH